MKATKFVSAMAVAFVCTAPQAFAQAKNFEGFSVVLGANSASSSANMRFNTGAEYSGSGTGSYASLQGQYTFALTDKYVFGVGATAALNSYSLGSLFTTINLDGTQKQQISLDLMPGYAMSENAMLFGKLSYIDAKSSSAGVLGTTDKDSNGLGYGIGVRFLADKKLFWQVGYDSVVYSDITTATSTTKLKSSVLSVGLGYKF